mmetsp:Transcript_70194/g.177524  ORF Transcript_70194/g.177524 Transcript_70194/m.177524 type:complete len:271 (-) Transcript_70194:956-1768(-)
MECLICGGPSRLLLGVDPQFCSCLQASVLQVCCHDHCVHADDDAGDDVEPARQHEVAPPRQLCKVRLRTLHHHQRVRTRIAVLKPVGVLPYLFGPVLGLDLLASNTAQAQVAAYLIDLDHDPLALAEQASDIYPSSSTAAAHDSTNELLERDAPIAVIQQIEQHRHVVDIQFQHAQSRLDIRLPDHLLELLPVDLAGAVGVCAREQLAELGGVPVLPLHALDDGDLPVALGCRHGLLEEHGRDHPDDGEGYEPAVGHEEEHEERVHLEYQ